LLTWVVADHSDGREGSAPTAHSDGRPATSTLWRQIGDSSHATHEKATYL